MRFSWRGATICGAVGLLTTVSGCAKAPAGASRSLRLAVTIQFAGPINPNYRYYVLIRNGADPSGTNGPIAVIAPPYGNGFATSFLQSSPTAGFTDFVEYSRVQEQATISGYAVYHVPGGIGGNPNTGVFISRGEPDFSTPPGNTNQLYFELPLSRLTPIVSSGEPDPNNGQTPRYLQMNIIATTKLSFDPQNVDPNKYVDAIGDQHPGSGSFNTFINVDAAQVGHIYQNSPDRLDPQYEPDNDTYPAENDPAIEMTGWRIQVLGG